MEDGVVWRNPFLGSWETHLDLLSPMVILAGEGGVVRHHPAGRPSNTAGVHQPEVRDRLAQADLVGSNLIRGPAAPIR